TYPLTWWRPHDPRPRAHPHGLVPAPSLATHRADRPVHHRADRRHRQLLGLGLEQGPRLPRRAHDRRRRCPGDADHRIPRPFREVTVFTLDIPAPQRAMAVAAHPGDV